MNNKQIEIIMKSDPVVSESFKGVFPCDKIPIYNNGTNCYIVNTDPLGNPGEHWVCIFQNNGNTEYFDSYGFPPLVKEIKSFIGTEYIYNKCLLQDFDSTVCGEYCIYFLYYRCRNYSMYDIVKYLKSVESKNDEIVDDFVRQRFEIPLVLEFHQRCTSRNHGYTKYDCGF